MAYTHYWHRPARLPQQKFIAAAKQWWRVADHLGHSGRRPCHEDRVSVDGQGAGQEDFILQRQIDPGRPRRGLCGQSCRTSRGPYDAAVCAALIVFKHAFGERFLVRSDGGDEDEGWARARRACQGVLGYGSDFTLAAAGIQRLSPRGLAYTRLASKHAYRLANGWVIECFETRPSRRHPREPVTVSERVAGSVKFVLEAESVRLAAWKATCEHLRRVVNHVISTPYAEAAAEVPGDWTAFFVLADHLDEKGVKHQLRLYLPRAPLG
jgi:hypothetical protein